jgi:hypothetical protein
MAGEAVFIPRRASLPGEMPSFHINAKEEY